MSNNIKNEPLTREQIKEFIEASKNMSAGNIELSGDRLELFNRVMERRPAHESLTEREYNKDDDPDGDAKQKILEDFSSEVGCCYLQLVTASDTVLKMKVGDFGLFMSALRMEMGQFPMADAASQCVGTVYSFWKNGVKMNEEEIDRRTQLNITLTALTVQEEMLHSGARFKLIETSVGYHLSATTFGPCGCPSSEVLCDHGWASKYVMCAVARNDRRLGGSQIDIDAFFSTVCDEEPEAIDSEEIIRVNQERLAQLEKAQEKLHDICDREKRVGKKLRDASWSLSQKFDMARVGEISIDEMSKKSAEIQQLMEKLQFEADSLTNEKEELHEWVLSQPVDFPSLKPLRRRRTTEDTIIAGDSASNVGGYHVPGMFMQPGTVIADACSRIGRPNVSRTISTRLPDVPETTVGFVQTEDLYAGDVAARQSVVPINGLSKPFINQRMNLLGHVYTGLNIINRESDSNNLYTTLTNLRKSKLNSPPVQLFRQVLNCTFDWEEGMVKSNPFKLPYIEVGMSISEDSLIKCFELLNSEYKNLWFSELKQMQVPAFANEFVSLSDFSLKGSRRSTSTSGSKTSESLSEDRSFEGVGAQKKGSSHQRRNHQYRKDSGSSSRSSILGFSLK